MSLQTDERWWLTEMVHHIVAGELGNDPSLVAGELMDTIPDGQLKQPPEMVRIVAGEPRSPLGSCLGNDPSLVAGSPPQACLGNRGGTSVALVDTTSDGQRKQRLK